MAEKTTTKDPSSTPDLVLVNGTLTDDAKAQIRELILSTLSYYDNIIRVKSGSIECTGSIQNGEDPRTGAHTSRIVQASSVDLAQMIFSNFNGTPGTNITGTMFNQTPSGMNIYGLHSGFTFYIETDTDYPILSIGAGGITLGAGTTFYSSDGSAGVTTSQTFKDGSGATKTMTIKNGIITAIA